LKSFKKLPLILKLKKVENLLFLKDNCINFMKFKTDQLKNMKHFHSK
jgi:hypothetical protein